MSNFIEVIAIVEGKTEEIFINSLLQPYLAQKMVFMTPTQVSKPGQKGGDVKFERVKKDLEIHLKQRADTYVTTLVDFYGVREWPGIDLVPANASPAQIAEIVNGATQAAVVELFAAQRADRRFIPHMAIHEFEALLFSDSASLATELDIAEEKVTAVLNECGEPEAINNSPVTAPSKRLDGWSRNGEFPKTTTGIAVARSIGIQRMREQCPLFDAWLQRFEAIVGGQA
ncbi:DUF4276 family protein [Desulfuromonas thiophila]|uniref:DUF4276 family protein n=1 Tax=Desulfuromonas thiophila TaxID=57664 RepID=A0A1G7DWI1_9BACT|nr:DUF4276 family protein [Desulfuromonas thiophila]SDE55791.1 protein of unknown function [Desulfuromonas thiophila]